MESIQDYPVLIARPYQLLCIVCSLGEDGPGPGDPRLKEILDTIRANPDMPVAVRCNSTDQFAYQNPGTQDDTAEGAEYNMKRDLDILQRLDLVPGSILPARALFKRLLKTITSAKGICGYDTVTSEAWRGCSKAGSGYYERGREKGINALIPPRDEDEMARDKETSLKDMYQADAIKIRPHILVCAMAQYGNDIRPPFKEDNLPEMIQHILKNPDTPITLVSGGDWMMCGPCPNRAAELNGCVTGAFGTGGLYNELKDLNVLQTLGLTYGATMKAKELYEIVFERFDHGSKRAGVCAMDGEIPDSSMWRDVCGRRPGFCPGFEKGREMLMKALNLSSGLAESSSSRHHDQRTE